MIDPIAIGQTKEYILKREREIKDGEGKVTKPANPNPTVWIIGALDSMEMNRVDSLSMKVEQIEGRVVISRNAEEVFKKDFTVVRLGLKGFRNFGSLEFKTDKVRLFDCEKDVVHDDVLKAIHPDVIYELSQEIWGSNKVDEELEKN
jgi:hypothetical protein